MSAPHVVHAGLASSPRGPWLGMDFSLILQTPTWGP